MMRLTVRANLSSRQCGVNVESDDVTDALVTFLLCSVVITALLIILALGSRLAKNGVLPVPGITGALQSPACVRTGLRYCGDGAGQQGDAAIEAALPERLRGGEV